jgi:hypothetical protein
MSTEDLAILWIHVKLLGIADLLLASKVAYVYGNEWLSCTAAIGAVAVLVIWIWVSER